MKKVVPVSDQIVSKLNAQLKPLDSKGKRSKGARPIFIIGLPRSGTTVLEQVMLHVFKLGYIDNIAAKFWDAPEYGVGLSNSLLPFGERGQKSFESNFGFIDDVFGPHEFGYFWKRFFDYGRGHHEVADIITTKQKRQMRDDLDRLVNTFNKSFVFKNPAVITLNAELLYNVLPNALFIVIERDTMEVANSNAEARKQYFGSLNEWFSGIPKKCAKIAKKGDPFDQLALQTASYEDNLAHFMATAKGDKRVYVTNYVSMVSDLDKQMKSVAKFLKAHGVKDHKFLAKVPSDKVTYREKKITYRKELEKAFAKIK